MKQKTKNTNSSTQQKLLSILRNLPTKEDFEERFKQQDSRMEERFKQSELRLEEKLEKKFDNKLQQKLTETHNIMIERILKSQDAFRREIDHKIQTSKEEILANMAKFKSIILKVADTFVKEIEINREDREIGTAQIKRVEDEVEDIKIRVAKLEHS